MTKNADFTLASAFSTELKKMLDEIVPLSIKEAQQAGKKKQQI